MIFDSFFLCLSLSVCTEFLLSVFFCVSCFFFFVLLSRNFFADGEFFLRMRNWSGNRLSSGNWEVQVG